MRVAVVCVLLLLAIVAAPARAGVAERPWPPAEGPGTLFAHFGEEHVNDADGATILPAVVGSVAQYRPALATMSGDKANDGEADQLRRWQEVMSAFDRAGVPYLAGMGNHDRNAPPGVPGGTIGLFGATTPDSIEPYRSFFKDRPYPWGDGKPYEGVGPLSRPQDDPAGASTHYAADVGDARWIILDNSCWSLTGCDAYQQASDATRTTQFEFLRTQAAEASREGRAAFVVMHMPTRDPRDQSYTDVTARNHVMMKGGTSDNARFEQIAESTGVDGVFLGHIKGQFLYRGRGSVPYFIDGGAGGELYTTGPVGVDHGYWHGYRLLRTEGGTIAATDTVPIFVRDGLTIEGPDTLLLGKQARYAGFGRQPVYNDTAKVERLELRDPAPIPKPPSSLLGGLGGAVTWGGPLGLLLLFVLVRSAAQPARRLVLVTAVGAVAVGGVAVAQQGTPTSTPAENLPAPARIWTSEDPRVLRPVADPDDDPRRDLASQTIGGSFQAACPGTTRVRLTSGWETVARTVRVPSRADPIAVAIRAQRRVLRRGRRAAVARVKIAQPAIVRVRVHRGKRVVRELVNRCAREGTTRAAWTPTARGRYTIKVTVLSDRAPQRRTFRVRVR